MDINKYLGALITCHNRKNTTLVCLQNLFNCKLPTNWKIEVFLVDDGSTDGTANSVKKQFPQVNVIQGNGQLFWNRGMHLAWQTAINRKAFDGYLWLNDDTILFPKALNSLIDDADKQLHKSIICGTTQSKKNYEFTYGGKLSNGALLKPNGSLQKCDMINGNCVLVSKFVYESIGMLDPIFPHAIGDYEFGLRARKNNIDCFVASEVIGHCEFNINLPDWCIPGCNIIKRVKSLYSPLGSSHPYYFFVFENRHYGLAKAIKHFFSIHLRLMFPRLWIR